MSKQLRPRMLRVAHGRYRMGTYENSVYEITQAAATEYASHYCGLSSERSWSLRETRKLCEVDLAKMAGECEAQNMGVQRLPDVGTLESLLARRGLRAFYDSTKLFQQALLTFGSARAAAKWLMQPNPKFGGALPFLHATYKYKWYDVFDALVHLEYQHLLPPE
jgi:hypothetical protein